MIKELDSIKDLCSLKRGDQVRTADRFRLFTDDPSIGRKVGNPPFQGINWLGEFPALRMVMIRSRYKLAKDAPYPDGWIDDLKAMYPDRWNGGEEGDFLYYLKIRHRNTERAIINYDEKANRSLLNQKQHGYPILLMVDDPVPYKQLKTMTIEGRFKVIKICHDNPINPGNDSVLLQRIDT